MSNRKRHVGDRDMPPPSKVLGVFGLNLDTSDRELRKVFEKYGRLEDAMIIHDRKSGMSRGFGFVYFEHADDAQVAKEETNGLDIDGRGKKIRVDFSVTKRPHTPTPGQYMGRPTVPRYSRGYGGRDGGGRGGGGGGGGYGGRNSRRSYSRSRSRSPRNSKKYRSRSRSPAYRKSRSRSYSRSRSRSPQRYRGRR